MAAEYFSEAVAAAIAGTAGMFLTKLFDHIRASRKEENESKREELYKAVDLYRDLIKELRSDIDEMLVSMKQLENEYIKSREENAALKAQVKSNMEKIGKIELENK